MQIDFHHTVTYVVARFSGFDHSEAQIVAHAAQYVDDATNSGVVRFDNGAIFSRYATAHGMIQMANWKNAENLLCWVPFHFLPGNCGEPFDSSASAKNEERLVCVKDSLLAQEMAAACVSDKQAGEPYALYRLGITAHVYADTWAHQGFVGMVDPLNGISDIKDARGRSPISLGRRLVGWFDKVVKRITDVPGHALALDMPDRPYLHWSYRSHNGTRVNRDNPESFAEAADGLCRLFQTYLGKHVLGLSAPQQQQLFTMLKMITSISADERHREWLLALKNDNFGFGPVEIDYIPKGVGSWKHQALGTTNASDVGDEIYAFNPQFLSSHWRLFHTAAKAHVDYVVESLLPKYGIAIR